MLKSISINILVLSFFVFETLVHAGTITSEIDRTQSEAGEPFQITVSVSGSLSGDVEAPKLDGFEFEVTGQSSSTSIINGSISTERQLIYTVVPTKTGKFEIPPFKAKLDGKVESTLPITVEVGGVPQAQQQPNQGQNSKGNRDSKIGDKIFIVRELPKNEFYVGEVIPTVVKIYAKVRVAKFSRPGTSAQNFRAVPVQGEKQYRESMNNEIYSVNEVYELLIPKKAGELKLPTFSVDVAYVQPMQNRGRNPDPFDLFNFFRGAGQTVQAKVESPERVIKVLEPPVAGRPENYADIVGQFKGAASLNPQKVKVGETITITYSLEGEGALDSMVDPKFDFSKFGKVYTDRPDLQEKLERNRIMSTRVQKIALVPATAGKLDLSNLDIGYFDPKDKKYKSIDLKLGSIEVEADANAVQSAMSQKKKEEIPAAAPTGAPESSKQILTASTVTKISWIAGGFVGLLLLVGFVRFGNSKWKNHQQKPEVIAKLNEKEAQHILVEVQKAKSFEQLYTMLQKYVSKLETIEPSAVTSKDIVEILHRKYPKPEVIGEFAKLLKAFEKTKYATSSAESLESLLEKARSVLLNLK